MRRSSLFLALAFGLLAILSGLARAAITGPDQCNAGELTVLESDMPASWAVHPVEYQSAIYPIDGGVKCIFASPNAGAVTFFAASVIEGNPVIHTHVLYNGKKSPQPDPKPEPVPDPTTLDGVAKAELAKIATQTKAAEQTAMVAALDNVISGIDRGTIQTSEGARATFRGVWSSKAAEISVDSVGAWANWLTAVSEKLDQTDVQTIKAGFETLKAVLKPATKEPLPIPVNNDPIPVADKPKSECKNGSCPAPGGSNQSRNYSRWRR